MNQESILNAAENAAAISAEFHADQKAYDAVYEATCNAVSGFPGIYKEIAKIGVLMAEQEDKIPDVWHLYNWIETCDAITTWLKGYCVANGWPTEDMVKAKLQELLPA